MRPDPVHRSPGTRRPPEVHRALRVTGLLLLAGYLGFMAWWALRPDPSYWMRDTNLTPLATVRADLAGGGTGYLALAQGLLLAAPLGVLLPMAGGRIDVTPVGSLLRTTAGGLLLATAQELLETAGAGKVLDVDDILLAVAGVTLCHLALVPAGRAALRRRGPRAEAREEHPEALGVGLPPAYEVPRLRRPSSPSTHL